MKAAVPKTEKENKVRVALPDISERHQVHIINPMSGRGAAGANIYSAVEKSAAESGGEILKSERPGHIEELAAQACAKDPFVHIIAYGGDGTVNETVSGIMKSGAARTASFSVVPVGSGNDFSAYVNDSGVFAKAELNKIDVVRVTCGEDVRYFANMMNIGFDCNVVKETYTLKKKPFLHGSAAYIAGVAKTLILKKTFRGKVTLEGVVPFAHEEKPTAAEVFEQKILLTAAANSRYCGGGFRAAPLASLTDGLLDVLVVNNVSRLRFLTVVGAYRAGSYIDENGVMGKSFSKILTYRKCRKMTVEGPEFYCLDGEVYPTGESRTVEAEVLPGAMWYAAL